MPSVFKYNGNEIIDSSGNVTASAFPTGSIVQTKTYIETTNWQQSYNGSSGPITLANASGTNFAVSITPKVTGSKNLLTVSIGKVSPHNTSSGWGLAFRCMRDSTPVGLATGSNLPLMSFAAGYHSIHYVTGVHFTCLDSNANTAGTAITYTLQFQTHAGASYTVSFNRGSDVGTTANDGDNAVTSSSYIVQEVMQ